LTWGGGPVERQLAISDFWLEQSRVFVRESCRDSSVEVFADAIRETSSLVVRPKLLVLVDSSVATGAQAEGARNADLGTDQVALITEAQRPGVGPLLHLTNDDATANLAEAAAAIAAMS
jgi:hypothetical protein